MGRYDLSTRYRLSWKNRQHAKEYENLNRKKNMENYGKDTIADMK